MAYPSMCNSFSGCDARAIAGQDSGPTITCYHCVFLTSVPLLPQTLPGVELTRSPASDPGTRNAAWASYALVRATAWTVSRELNQCHNLERPTNVRSWF